jgi:hypothetical protein
MKPETEATVMKDHFMKSKEEAVTCLRAMGAELPEGMDPCSWEGVMTMYEDVIAHGKPPQNAQASISFSRQQRTGMQGSSFQSVRRQEGQTPAR